MIHYISYWKIELRLYWDTWKSSSFICLLACDDCGKQFISGDCPDHGPLEWYGDSQLSNETPKGDQAKLTLPNNLNIMPSAVWQGQLGVFAKARMEKQVIFGPFKGQKIPAKEFPLREDHNFKYMWDVSMQ